MCVDGFCVYNDEFMAMVEIRACVHQCVQLVRVYVCVSVRTCVFECMFV